MRQLLIAGPLAALLLAACSAMRPATPPADDGHLADPGPRDAAAIPEVVERVPFVPPPAPSEPQERYTVVVNDVPVRELLFALARDAELNVDVAGDVDGRVTLNAIDQTLPQILERVARQVSLRWSVENGTIVIGPDAPYLRTYDVGYVNLARDVDTTVNVATRVATTGGGSVDEGGAGRGGGGGAGGVGDNTSSTRLEARSYNRFWETLERNILAIIDAPDGAGNDVIVNAEAGMISVRATDAEHAQVGAFIDRVLVNARRQVLIEATIVEVSLNDQYQAGVDWTVFLETGEPGFTVDQRLLGQITDGAIDNAVSSFTVGYFDPDLGNNAVSASVRLLREFGDARVLSSPRLMVLNNQTAILKVVEELVYFTIEVTDRDAGFTQQGRIVVESEVRSVPVGLVMAVTPQISPNDEVTLTVRPTISQKIGDAVDPGPQIALQFSDPGTAENITNTVPIIRVREMESVLKLIDGQIGVLGGLMQDELRSGEREVPGLARVPLLGDLLFDSEELVSNKTELVIFLRPVVIGEPSVQGDLAGYRRYLRGASPPPGPAP